MKKFFGYFMLATVAVAAFISCAKNIEDQYPVENGIPMKTITVITDIQTKTTLDANHENIIWTAQDSISLFNDVNNTNTKLIYTSGGDLTVSVPAETTDIYAHYPYYSKNTSGPTSVSIYISNDQTQTNPGELNGYYFPMVAKGTVSADNKALVQFYPVASALALNIYHTGLEGEESVEFVRVTPAAANTKFTGSQATDITANNVTYTEGAYSNPITVTLTNPLSLGNTKPTDKQTFAGQIYVCLAKQSYANVKFEIKTDKGTYTITSNSTAFDLVNNDFVPVNINLASQNATFVAKPTAVDPTAFNWGLVKDALTVGDKVVIAAANTDFAMSTEQKTNNRGQVEITKSGSALTAVADVQVFEVVNGSKSNTVALKCLNGSELGNYISAVSSSSNNMHSVDAIDDNSSWSITIDGTTGVASVTAQGTYTRNTLRHNSGSSLFHGGCCFLSSHVAFGQSFFPRGFVLC